MNSNWGLYLGVGVASIACFAMAGPIGLVILGLGILVLGNTHNTNTK